MFEGTGEGIHPQNFNAVGAAWTTIDDIWSCKMQLKYCALAAAAALCLSSGTALAHHSFAMFDLKSELTIEGVVKELQWTNPHIQLEIAVRNPKGAMEIWSIEGASPNNLVRSGFTRNTVKAGDKVKVTYNPYRRSGEEKGGFFVNVILPDGRVLPKRSPS